MAGISETAQSRRRRRRPGRGLLAVLGVPGIGPISALRFKTAVDDSSRFAKSKVVCAYFGLTPKRWQSGTSIDIKGHISKAGDGDVRRTLYEAANIMLTRFKGKSALKTWGQALAKKKGHKKACVAVARKFVVIMHAMWRDGSEFRLEENAASRKHRGRKAQILGAAMA